MTRPGTLRRLGRYLGRLVLLLLLLLLGPFSMLAFGEIDTRTHWSQRSMASSGLAPDPHAEPEPLIQIYGARAYGWRGAFGIHTWVATKRQAADHYSVYQVLGWRHYRGRPTVEIRRGGTPDFHWFNAEPELLLEKRGAGVEALIDRIESAVADYPYPHKYHVWPGPNSNSFTAYLARQIPELGLDLPPTAIGKDFLHNGRLFDRTTSGTGWQFSLYGLLGASLAREEGIEVNLLGLSVGIDFNDLALRLPGVGKLGLLP